MNRHEKRLSIFRKAMTDNKIDLAFIMASGDMQYFTGIPREPHNPTNENKHGDQLYGAWITPGDDLVIVAPRLGASSYVRSHLEGKPWIKDVVVINDHDNPMVFLKNLLSRFGLVRKLAVSNRTWAQTLLLIKEADENIDIINAAPTISAMRAVKDDYEIAIMEKAGSITDQVFGAVFSQMKPGITQYEIAREIDHQVISHGGSGNSFHTTVFITGNNVNKVYGPNGTTDFTPVKPGSVIAFDFGLIYQGYVSDFGRTVYCGEPDEQQRKIHNLVITAQEESIKAMKNGQIKASEINMLARSIIDTEGLGQYFIHRLGHGIGIDVHEPPYLYELDQRILLTGMCFTIEPSIWFPGGPLTRVEDVVMVTPEGGVPFSNYSKDLLVI